MREQKEGHTSSKTETENYLVRLVFFAGEDVLAARGPAAAAAGGLLRLPETVAVLRGSAAGVAAAQDRGPAGEELGGRRDARGRLRLRGQAGSGGGPRPDEGLPAHRGALHGARAARGEATPVGRETSNRWCL